MTGLNPVLPVSPGNPTADPSHGFLVLNQNNASLFTNETEGPVAVGGGGVAVPPAGTSPLGGRPVSVTA
ncbi:hypothetical protein [Pseudofrankia inefficax]|uniref:hypothetical protein n=1 Tax=Pseudofrankia inefficax (strain DSM 45817 / CECT 9037 / DDB 130130 / EuI1c) TaxID=298654 RepID=UPI0001BFAB0B|nr:hypothetical protein [Pseudofrankia inefficax]